MRSSATCRVLTLGLMSLHGCGARTELLPSPIEMRCPSPEIQTLRIGEVEQMDLLFVIDNSRSMADKQALLRDAVPGLIRRLANPLCVSSADRNLQLAPSSPDAACPSGLHREFEPVSDMHIGVITTSLGAHGADLCRQDISQQLDDRAHLVGAQARGAGIATYQNSGFLDWDPKKFHLPPGEGDIAELANRFEELVSAAGDNGCGIEASLEAWYRFLIDPKPAERTIVSGGIGTLSGLDRVLLQQRAAFLRPDSLVAIVMLSDENDCSAIEDGSGWLIGTTTASGQPFKIPPSTSSCDQDPNSPCCRSCGLQEPKPPRGCASLQDEARCRAGAADNETINLRCFEQKRRFGFDLLYPTARYAVGLRERKLCPDSVYHDADCSCRAALENARRLGNPLPRCTTKETGAPVANPLFSQLSSQPAFQRDGSQVFLAGILGVPWQDIATSESLEDPRVLEYLTAADLSKLDPRLGVDRWQLILGDPLTHTPPLDPFMRESIAPRTGANPLTFDPVVGPNSLSPQASPINGHERDTSGVDLQYACIFPLQEPRGCSAADDSLNHCDCYGTPPPATDPICQPPTGGPSGNTQYFAKAYPALRQLDVLRQHGGNSVIASICPKNVANRAQEFEFGYRPALAGLVKRLRCANLTGKFNDQANSAGFGTINCRLLALRKGADSSCQCDPTGRREPSAFDRATFLSELRSRGACGGSGGLDCNSLCICEIPQTSGSALEKCQRDTSATPVDELGGTALNGWCYVDPEHGFGAPELVSECPTGNLRNLRLLGNAAPQTNEQLFSLCGDACSDEVL